MTDHDETRGKFKEKPLELWAKIWPLLLILVVTYLGWCYLSTLALHARVQDPAQIAKGPTTVDYSQAKTWATELLGLAGSFAGFLGIAAATHSLRLTETQREESAVGGMIGILAGATLLNAGGWPVPIALGAMVTGAATVRLVRALRKAG